MIARLSVGVLWIALFVLGAFQYRWIGQTSIVERQRLERVVRESSYRFAEDFAAEVRYLANTLEVRDGVPVDATPLLWRYQDWLHNSSYPNLLRALYLVRPGPGESPELLHVDFKDGFLQPAVWPREFGNLEEFLSRELDAAARERPFAGPSLSQIPRSEGVVTLLIPVGRLRERSDFDRRDENERRSPPRAWLLAELDEQVIVKDIFPAVAERNFPATAGSPYRVAVLSLTGTPRVVFSTGSPWTEQDRAYPDASVDLAGSSAARPSLPGPRGPGGPGGPGGRGDSLGAPGPGGPRGSGRAAWGFGPGYRPVPFVGQNWRLLVKHQAGSLEAAVNKQRWRNLAISFGILALLGVGGTTAVLSGHRARALGKLQMEFAAGVSHELRTPLTVIQSAAHNLRTGLVRDSEGIEQYAAIVQNEARRLADMVEQVMAYTQTQSGRKRYDIAPFDVMDLVDRAVQNSQPVLRDANAVVERRIDSDLPPIMADATAMTQCLQNLISNAVKYGRRDDGVRIEIEGRLDAPSQSVCLTVADHGKGVPEADVPHLFEAFHRGSNTTPHTPGNGLGLYLVQKLLEAQNGTVSYEPNPAGGSRFTMALPAAAVPV